MDKQSSNEAVEILRCRHQRERTSLLPDPKCGELVWDQVTIDRLWVTTQREAMIEAGPPPAVQETNAPSAQQGKNTSVQKTKEPAKK